MGAAINVVGFPSSQKTPGIYLAVVLGGPGTTAGVAPMKILMIGNMIGSIISGATPSFSVAAGTATSQVAVQVFSAADAGTKFGLGSELHLMALRVFAIWSQAQCWAIPTVAGTGTATGVITFTGGATAALTVQVLVNGQACNTSVNSGDSLTTTATNVATTINQQTNWPVTAQISVGVLTLTAKEVNLRSNAITFRLFLISGTTQIKATAGALAAVLTGLTATLSGGTVVGSGAYCLSGGSTEESLTTPLANVAAVLFDRYACAQQGATPLAAVNTQLSTMAGVLTQLRQQAVAGNTLAAATATTGANAIALGLNSPRFQLGWMVAADCLPGEISAAICAARINGDGASGGRIFGESTDPAANQDGLNLATIPVQDNIADQPTPTVIESELNIGVTPLVPSSLAPGFAKLPRVITTRWQDGSGNPNFAVIDCSSVTVPDYVANQLQIAMATDFAGMKLGPDAPDGSGPKIANMTSPKLVRNYIYRALKGFEAQGIIINVDAHFNDLQIQTDPTTVGRVLADIPCVPAPALHQVAGNVRQLSN